jgi:hypothetical protein
LFRSRLVNNFLKIAREIASDSLAEPPAAQDSIAIIKHRALPRSDSTLRRIKGHANSRGIKRLNRGTRGSVLVADFHGSAKRRARAVERDPIYLLDFACRGAQRLIVAHDDAIILAVDSQHVKRLARRESQSLALADREIMDAIVTANDRAFFSYDVAASIRQRSAILP